MRGGGVQNDRNSCEAAVEDDHNSAVPHTVKRAGTRDDS
jgi:hypothetical protein